MGKLRTLSIGLIVFLALFTFALWTNSQQSDERSKEPKVFLIGEDFEVPNEFSRSDKTIEFEKIKEEDVPLVFPTEDTSLFGYTEGSTDIEAIMEWARENNQKEIYFYEAEIPPAEEMESSGFPFDSLDFTKVFDLFSPTSAWAAPVGAPLCGVGNLRPADFSYSWACPFDAGPCDNCTGDGLKPKMTVRVRYQHYDTCHGIPIAFLAMDNVFRPVDSHSNPVNGVSLVVCSNAHNGGSPYMCIPVNLQIDMYDGTSHPDYPCSTDANTFGCATVGTLTTPRKSIDEVISLRQGKFVDNRWIVRHEAQHTYGWNHGVGAGSCSSFGNGESITHCCNTHVVKP
jgi:hypothetical protein